MREAVQGYRAQGLADALERAEAALAAAGIACELDRAPRALPAEVESVLAWAVREGTTNVVRHSGAGRCSIRVRAERDAAAVEVDDDGAHAGADATAGSGLAGLAERAERLRGTLEAGAAPGWRLPAAPLGAVAARMIRVLIAEDQAMVRGALASLLALEGDIEVVAEVDARRRGARGRGRARGPTSRCSTSRCPVATASARRPSSCACCRARGSLILTTFGRPGYLRRALEQGASGFLLKDAPGDASSPRRSARSRPACAPSTRRSPPPRSPRARAR